ncbi:LysR family transcriptional regulator [Acidiphilium multivorum]|uniref:LysR substrate-binding domain-containing protein n=1 Tax=Acidiphilium multivorum TaxID=62140 RepID=UPI003211A922
MRDMRWAIVASQHRSLRQAAESLNVRQSTLSRRLREMEAKLGAQLFERSNGGTHPTLAGRDFLVSAQRILAETDASVHRLLTQARGENGQLTIGIYASLSTGNMFATLVEHRRGFPNVEIFTADGSHDQLLCALANGTVDIAVMTASRLGWDNLALPLWSERVILAVHASHPLLKKGTVGWPDLAGETILIPHHGPGPELERLLISRLRDWGAQRILRQEAGLDRLLSLVAAERGTLLMLEGGTGIHYDNVVYREIHQEDGPTRLPFMAYWRQSNANPALIPFLEILRQRYPDLSGQ